MTTPAEKRNELLGAKMTKAFEKRHIECHYCASSKEAIEKVKEMIPKGSSITWGGSMTLRDMGLTQALHNDDYQIYDRDLCATREEAQEIYRKAFYCDYFLSSANALTEDGMIVNIDGNGNRVAAITFGPKHVIIVAGMNKVAADLPSAISRARHTAAPINTSRLQLQTPCAIDGVCHDCHSPQCICNVLQVIRNNIAGRISVVLVGEDLGY